MPFVLEVAFAANIAKLRIAPAVTREPEEDWGG
jgi:hypothetical protein